MSDKGRKSGGVRLQSVGGHREDGLVLEILTDRGKVHLNFDGLSRQDGWVTDTGVLENGRAAKCTC